jgi:hypothetical protein
MIYSQLLSLRLGRPDYFVHVSPTWRCVAPGGLPGRGGGRARACQAWGVESYRGMRCGLCGEARPMHGGATTCRWQEDGDEQKGSGEGGAGA